MDLRQQKTKSAIILAFEELISKKRYDEITVQQIIDKADVGRTAFYAHFENKGKRKLTFQKICTLSLTQTLL